MSTPTVVEDNDWSERLRDFVAIMFLVLAAAAWYMLPSLGPWPLLLIGLALDPDNVSALRRLGQIELSLGEYEKAHEHLQQAYTLAPNQQAGRFLLGESYAVAGDVERAAALWGTISNYLGWDHDKFTMPAFAARQRWYEEIGEMQRAQWITETINLVESEQD